MPDVIVLHYDQVESELVERLAVESGFRCKTTTSSATAQGWLKIGDFSAVLAHRQIPLREQKDLANLLWAGNPESTFAVFDLDPDNEFEAGESRLLGAEVVAGRSAMSGLVELFRRLHEKRSIKAADFRILVVEDLDSPRYVISLYIEEIGYSLVEGAASAKEALRELESDPSKFACIVTDIRMPEMDGTRLIEAIRNHPKLLHLPVIVLTAYGTSDALIDCLKAGASGFLVKPPKKMDLMRELGRARRIAAKQASPRLANPDEVELIRRILESRGLA